MASEEELISMIHELRNALIVAANNAHQRKKEINLLDPHQMFTTKCTFNLLLNLHLINRLISRQATKATEL